MHVSTRVLALATLLYSTQVLANGWCQQSQCTAATYNSDCDCYAYNTDLKQWVDDKGSCGDDGYCYFPRG